MVGLHHYLKPQKNELSYSPSQYLSSSSPSTSALSTLVLAAGGLHTKPQKEKLMPFELEMPCNTCECLKKEKFKIGNIHFKGLDLLMCIWKCVCRNDMFDCMLDILTLAFNVWFDPNFEVLSNCVLYYADT